MSKRFTQQDGTTIVASKPNIGHTLAVGATVPTDGTKGYAPSCLFIDQDATGGSGWYINRGTYASCNFDAVPDLAAVTATAAELNYLDQNLSTNTLSRGAGVDTAESYVGSITRMGGLITTRILVDLTGMVGSATDLDIIGESAAASCHWGQITTAKSGTLIGGLVTCLELPAGGADDIDFYSSNVSTGTQDVIITDAALGTETALVTSGAAWASGTQKGMTALPTADDYIYIVNGEASGGTFTAGKFLIELFGA